MDEQEVQEFSLEDIMKEFGSEPEEPVQEQDFVEETLPEEELPGFKSYLQDVVSDEGALWMTVAQRKEQSSRNLGKIFLDMMEAFLAERIPQQKGTAADESGT